MEPLGMMGVVLVAAVLWVGTTLTMLTVLDHQMRRADERVRHLALKYAEHPAHLAGRRQTILIRKSHAPRHHAPRRKATIR